MYRFILCFVLQVALFFPTESQAGKIFSADFGTRRIQSSNLDGSNVTDVVTATPAREVAVSSSLQKIYWKGDVGMKSSNFDGSDIEVLLPGDAGEGGMLVDAVNGWLFWGNNSPGTINRMNLDGTNVLQISSAFPPQIQPELTQDLAIDPVNAKLYFADFVGLGSVCFWGILAGIFLLLTLMLFSNA